MYYPAECARNLGGYRFRLSPMKIACKYVSDPWEPANLKSDGRVKHASCVAGIQAF